MVQWLRRILDVDKTAVRFCVGPYAIASASLGFVWDYHLLEIFPPSLCPHAAGNFSKANLALSMFPI